MTTGTLGPLAYSEEQRDKIHDKWNSLHDQKPYAQSLLVISIGAEIANALAAEDPTHSVLGGVTLAGVIVGAIWVWHLRLRIYRVGRVLKAFTDET